VRELLTILLFLAAAFSGRAEAEPAIFHSPADDGVNPGTPPPLSAEAPAWVYLYVDAGTLSSAPGTACHAGSGEEVCGCDLLVEAGQNVRFLAFQPSGDVRFTLTGSRLRANQLDALAPVAGPKRIGQLLVEATDPAGGPVLLSSASVVRAGLELTPLTSGELVFVPEPTVSVLRVSSFAALVLLSLVDRRLRSARKEKS